MAIEFDGNLDREVDRILSKFSRLSYQERWEYFRTVQEVAGIVGQMSFFDSKPMIQAHLCFYNGENLPFILQQHIAFEIWKMCQPRKN